MTPEARDLARLGHVQVTTIGEVVRSGSDSFEHDAVVFPRGRHTDSELARAVHTTARRLRGLGVGPGDRVGLLLPQDPEYLVVLFAVVSIGAVGVPVNARFKARELDHVITDSAMTVLVYSTASPELAGVDGLVTEAIAGLSDACADRDVRGPSGRGLQLTSQPALRHVIHLGDGPTPPWAIDRATFETCGTGVDDLELRRLGVQVAVRQPAVLMYTSGTTANPKGALLSHEALVRKGQTVARTRFDLGADDRVWTPLPLYHIGGIAFAVGCLATGATYVHAGSFDADVAMAQLVQERCTVALPAFETIWMQILEHPEFEPDRLDALRVVFNVGVPARLRSMQEALPGAIQVSGFGSTEACSFVSISDVDDDPEVRATTCGLPLVDVDLCIMDIETGLDAPAGADGEICYRGPTTFSGYLNDVDGAGPGPDGWFHSGDLGHLRPDGRLVFVSRLKDMLKVGGENVAAAEVEGHLLEHPAVRLAQVVAASDDIYTEVAAAFVELAPSAVATEQELIDHCRGSIATFKVPRYVRFVDEWPMSGTKIKKHVLRAQLRTELEDRGISAAPRITSGDRRP